MNGALTDEMIRTRLSASEPCILVGYNKSNDGTITQVPPLGNVSDTDSNALQRSHLTDVDATTVLNPSSNQENPHHSYPSSPRASRMSMASAFSQHSSFSQDSSSSWHSITSMGDRPITPATTVSFSHTQHSSSNKHDSIDTSSLMNFSRSLSFNPSFSPYPPPSAALPPLPSPTSDSADTNSPVHSLTSEYSDSGISRENPQISTQQSHSHSHPDVKPPRPPRNPNRPLSPELSLNTKHSQTGPSSISPNSPAISGSGSPPPLHSRTHSQSYTVSSSSPQQSHVKFSHFYPVHTNLSHVTEEEEGQSLKSGTGSGQSDHRYDDIDVRSDYTDEREYDVDGHADDEGYTNRDFYLAQELHAGSETRRSVWSPYTSFLPSIYSAVSSEGGISPVSPSRSTSAVKNKWIESATLSQHARSHLNRLKKWKKRAVTTVIEGSSSKLGKEGAQIGALERDMVIKMISDGLEMARSCYSVRVHKLGYELGKEVQKWLQTFTDNDPAILNKRESVTLLTTVQTCFLPILLMRIAETEPTAATLASSIISALTKVPLSLHEDESSGSPLFTSLPSNNNNMPQPTSSSSPRNLVIPVIPQRTASISSIAIHMVSQELGSPTPICSSQHPWLGMTLLKIVEMTVKLRMLSSREIEDITMVGRKREGEYESISNSKSKLDSKSSSSPSLIDASVTRPWEVALFALCASTETPAALFFRRMVLGSMGIPLLIRSLDSLMALHIDMGDVKWEDVGLTIRALAFVSKHEWVVQGIGVPGGEDEGEVKKLVKSIMNVFWRSIPERWFSIRYWAMDTVRNIVSHQLDLVQLLADMEGDKAFITLTPSSPLYPPVINTTRTSADGKTRNKVLEEYRKESAKRAQEMVEFIRTGGGGATNRDDSRNGAKNAVLLQPVAIGFDGR